MEQVGCGLKGSVLRMVEEVVGLVFLLNLMEDLLALTVWPDQAQYLSRHVLILVASRRVAFPKMRRSSANNKWLMVGEFLATCIPLIFPDLSSFSSNLEKTSEPKINRKGERGSPCLRPLLGVN
jgi:hypothetical protein